MRQLALTAALLAGLGFVATPQAAADTMILTNGDTTYETVHIGYGGSGRDDLSSVLVNHRDPATGLPNPITAPDGSPLIVGSPDLGQNPAASAQTQIQAFYTDIDAEYKLSYIGLGHAGYLNVMGYYTRAADEHDPARFDYTPLITQGVDSPGTEVLFDVEADHYWGLYLSADGGRTERNRFFSENRYNPDSPAGGETDHMLAFLTNQGLLLAWEDLPRGSNGLLGDQDYEDMIGGLLTHSDGTPVPEPATAGLLGIGLGLMIVRRFGKRPN